MKFFFALISRNLVTLLINYNNIKVPNPDISPQTVSTSDGRQRIITIELFDSFSK